MRWSLTVTASGNRELPHTLVGGVDFNQSLTTGAVESDKQKEVYDVRGGPDLATLGRRVSES